MKLPNNYERISTECVFGLRQCVGALESSQVTKEAHYRPPAIGRWEQEEEVEELLKRKCQETEFWRRQSSGGGRVRKR